MTLISEIVLEETSILSDNDLLVGEESGGTSFKFQFSLLKSSLKANVEPPRGYMINGKLSVTVATNNLTVAVKTLADADPSASSPVRVRIGDAEHTLTAALSVTKNAGTNWCNAGGSELATLAVPYFVYLGYNATDGVTIGFSRIPYATAYSDFSATTTAETYAGISDISNAAAGDAYENVGYFHAILSAGAGYTWSSPTSVVSRPTFESQWVTWTPTLTGWSSNPTILTQYKVSRQEVMWSVYSSTTGTSNATTTTLTLPFTAANVASYNDWCVGRGLDNGNQASCVFRIVFNTKVLDAYQGPGNTAWTASGTKTVAGQGIYRIN